MSAPDDDDLPNALVPGGNGATADELIHVAIGQGWTPARVRQIASLLGESAEKVERRRVRVLGRVAKELEDMPSTLRAAQWMIEASWTQAQALTAGNFGAAVRVLSLKSHVLGLMKLRVETSQEPTVYLGLPDYQIDAEFSETGLSDDDEG